MLHHRWPDRACGVVADSRKRDSNAAALHEPVRNVGHQGPETGRTADPDKSVRECDQPQARRPSDREIPGRQRQCSDAERQGDAEPVRKTPHQHAAASKAKHDHGEGKRGVGATDAEISLDGGQRHHE